MNQSHYCAAGMHRSCPGYYMVTHPCQCGCHTPPPPTPPPGDEPAEPEPAGQPAHPAPPEASKSHTARHP